MAIDLPTLRWRDEMNGGDDLFTEEGVAEVEAVLRKYAADLGELEAGEPSERILLAMKSAVLALNEIGGLDGRHGNFIETSEREELCEYLFSLARGAGLVLAQGDDPTADWRDW